MIFLFDATCDVEQSFSLYSSNDKFFVPSALSLPLSHISYLFIDPSLPLSARSPCGAESTAQMTCEREAGAENLPAIKQIESVQFVTRLKE